MYDSANLKLRSFFLAGVLWPAARGSPAQVWPRPRPLTCPCMDVKAAEIPANDTPVAAAEEATVSDGFTQHSAEGWRREVQGKTGRSSR